MKRAHFAIAAVVLLALQACSSNAPKEPEADLSGLTSGAPTEEGPMKAAEIMQALSNKSFQYTRGTRSGVITFAPDGTFTYQEDGKGEGSGIWQASEGELCQAFNPTSFLPQGSRSECHPFRSSGGAYIAGQSRFQPV